MVGGVVVLIVLIHVCMYIYGQVYSGSWRGRVACAVGYCNGTGEVSCLQLVGMLDATGKKLIGWQCLVQCNV